MTLGDLILQYINEHDLSIRKFAQLSGVSHSYISYLIAGKKPNGLPLIPTIDKCVQIASAMGMDTTEMFGIINDEIAWGDSSASKRMELSLEERTLIRYYRSLKPSEKTVLLSVAHSLANPVTEVKE